MYHQRCTVLKLFKETGNDNVQLVCTDIVFNAQLAMYLAN